jgi:nitrite reductase/ring-hydroxylating ferredoxin subunit
MRKIRCPVARHGDILPDTGKVVSLGEQGECALFYHAGCYYAVGSLCPHQNAPLENAPVRDGAVICRRHGYRFELQTGDCLTLGGYGLPVYEVHVEDDTVFVSVWEYD